MIDRAVLREKTDLLKSKLAQRGVDADVDGLKRKDEELRGLLSKRDSLRNKRKILSEKINLILREGKDAENLKEDVRKLGGEISSLDETIRNLQESVYQEMLKLPNLQHPSVPQGTEESSNEIVRVHGEKPSFPFKPKDHIEIGLSLGILDFERAVRMSGSRFVLLKGA